MTTATIDGTPLTDPSQLTPDGIAGLHFTHRRGRHWTPEGWQRGGYDEAEVDHAFDMLEELVATLIRERDEARALGAQAATLAERVAGAPGLPPVDELTGHVAAALLDANEHARATGRRSVVSPPALPGVADHVGRHLTTALGGDATPEPEAMPTGTAVLTGPEHAVVTYLGKAWTLLVTEVIAPGGGQAGDLAELVGPIHAVQNAVLAQAAARAHPDRYRVLGLTHAEWLEAQP